MKKIKNIVTIILLLVAISLGSGKAFVDYKLNEAIHQMAASTEVKFNYADLFLNLQGNVVIEQANLQLPELEKIDIEKLTLHKAYQFYLSQGLPERAHITADNIQIALPDDAPPIPSLLSALGYAPYYLTFHELIHMGFGSIEANLELTTQAVNNKLQIHVQLDSGLWGHWIADLTLDKVQNLTDWESSLLETLTVSYMDRGLVENVFSFLAQRNQAFLPEFKQTLLVKLKTDINRANIQLDPTVLASLQQLVQRPGKLTLKLVPNSSVRLNQILYSTPQQLGLTMSTN